MPEDSPKADVLGTRFTFEMFAEGDGMHLAVMEGSESVGRGVIPWASFEAQLQALGYYSLETILKSIRETVDSEWHKQQQQNYRGPTVYAHPNNAIGHCPQCGATWYDLGTGYGGPEGHCCERWKEHGALLLLHNDTSICSKCRNEIRSALQPR